MNKVTARIIIDFIILLAIFNGWWFCIIPLGLIGLWFFPYFVEIVLAGIAYDALYNLIPGMGMRALVGTIISLTMLLIIGGLKKVLRK